MTFTPRKTSPRTIVRISQTTVACRLLNCAARTASAIVSELPMSTTVFSAPQKSVIDVLAATNASWYHVR